ncbi:hypothetical protein [Streptosporangium sp. KLBMP 9127]|nr:hypothetical protein [Streptosporangium sp. KLBMP 9127]
MRRVVAIAGSAFVLAGMAMTGQAGAASAVQRQDSGAEVVQLVRYFGGERHWSTTGPAPSSRYRVEGRVPILAEGGPGTLAIHGCLAAQAPLNQFLSADRACEGDKNVFLRTEGYVYKQAAPGRKAIYRCYVVAHKSHFFSVDPDCESTPRNPVRAEFRIGYTVS